MMNELKTLTRKAKRGAAFITILSLMIASSCKLCLGQAPPPRCQARMPKPPGNLGFVIGSARRVEQGADLQDTLDALECVAIWQGTPGATTAMFHLGADDQEMQNRLRRIITNAATSEDTKIEACFLLPLKCDSETRRAMIEHVRREWGSLDQPYQRRFLMDLGGHEAVDVLRDAMNATPEHQVMLQFRQRELRMARAANNEVELLELLSSGDFLPERYWLVQQAAGRGMDREKVRLAVLQYLRLGLARPSEGRSSLMRVCADLGVFKTEDELEWPELAKRQMSQGLRKSEYLPWATEHLRLMKEWRIAAP